MKLWKMLREKMSENATQIIKNNEEEFTYSATIKYAEIFADKIKNEKCCAIYCKSEILTAFILLACFAAGVTAIPLSVRYGEKHCEKILRKISPSCIITDLCGGLSVFRISNCEYIVPSRKVALIMCTSGTTGEPKGIMLSEENIISNITDIADYFNIDSSDAVLISRPLYHVAVLTGEFLLAITKGAKIVFDSDESFNPQKVLEQIAKHNITTLGGTPTLLGILARYNSRAKNKATLKHIVISGECMDRTTGLNIRYAFPDAKIYHVYGLTEASPRVCYLPSRYFDISPDCIGRPLKSVKIEIRNCDNTPVSNGTAGILWVYGPNIMLGYYKDKKQTSKVIKDGWLCTGDIAVVKPNGFLKILGRSDDMIIKAGINIYPAEIESVLKQDQRVHEVFVYAAKDKSIGSIIAMEITGDFKNKDEVKQLCFELLPHYQIPTKIELLSKMPRNGSGKIIRKRQNNA